nr:SDR family oxidoreductase [Pseudomonadales bacterium]
HIMVNAICPGLVDTERVDYIAAAMAPEGQSAIEYRADMVRDRASAVPLGRLAIAADIAKTAAFLASSESDYLTGQSINVAGGYEMH